jgi:hypothetical protein
MSNVLHWMVKDGKVTKKVDICFAHLPFKKESLPDLIRYVAPIKGHLDDKIVAFYIKFLNKTFDGKLFKAKILNYQKERSVLWVLDCKTMNRATILCYLTAFRYVTEYTGIIKDLYESSKDIKSLKNKFRKFVDIHQENGVCDGHSLIDTYKSDFIPIPLDGFKGKLNQANVMRSVYDFFEWDKPVKPLKQFILKERNIDYVWRGIKIDFELA